METLALFMRFSLSITPPLPPDVQPLRHGPPYWPESDRATNGCPFHPPIDQRLLKIRASYLSLEFQKLAGVQNAV
jgi:hypothetical protein